MENVSTNPYNLSSSFIISPVLFCSSTIDSTLLYNLPLNSSRALEKLLIFIFFFEASAMSINFLISESIFIFFKISLSILLPFSLNNFPISSKGVLYLLTEPFDDPDNCFPTFSLTPITRGSSFSV